MKNNILVARGTDLVVVRVVGSGNMVTAPVLHDFAEQELTAGFRRFVFDLGLCRGLDSTFMGCMVGLSNKVNGDDEREAESASPGAEPQELTPEEALKELQDFFHHHTGKKAGMEEGSEGEGDNEGPSDSYVIAVNVSAECRELMNILGVDNFVRIKGDVDLNQLEMATLAEKAIPVEERRKLILRAHENLVEIDQRNEAKFGAFLRTLSEELAKEA